MLNSSRLLWSCITPADWLASTRTAYGLRGHSRLADLVLKITGPTLADDAPLLVFDWHGHHGRDRTTVAGADSARAHA